MKAFEKQIIIGNTYQVYFLFTSETRNVTVRKQITKTMFRVSLGFDHKGNDILTLVLKEDLN